MPELHACPKDMLEFEFFFSELGRGYDQWEGSNFTIIIVLEIRVH